MTITHRPNGATIRALLTIAGILIVAWASAQNRRTFDLEKDYGVTPFTADLEIRHQHASPAAAKAAYPALFARLNGLGWSDALVMTMNIYPAAWNDAVLRGQGGGQLITGRVTSNNDIQAPAGSYPVDYPCVVDGGRYIGKGTGWTGPGSDSQNTEMRLDRAGWLGNVAEMHLIQSSTWGMLSGSNSYFEGCYISDFRLTGDSQGRWHDSGYESAGLALWDMGETGKVERIYSNTFNGYGVLLVRSTPATIDVVSLFQNSIAGVGIIGADLATIRFGTVSGDDNPSLFRVRPGYGREGGGAIEVACIKSESGKRTPIKGQIVLDAVGYVGFNAGTVSVAADYELIDALFVVETRGVNATVNVGNLRGYGYATLVQDVTNKKRWASPGNYRQLSFNWNSLSGGTFTSTVPAPQGACGCPGRLGTAKFVNGSYQTFDYAACTPSYDITGGSTPTPPPTPDPCTGWEVGPWGECINGTQTRTVTVVPAGCTGTPPNKPSETQSCSVTPPSGVIATLTAENNTTPTRSVPVDWKGVKRVVFEGVSFSTLNYQRFAWVSATDTRGVVLKPDGYFYTPGNQKVGPKITAGTKYDRIELVFPSAVDLSYYLAKPQNGAALVYSADKVTVYGN